MNLPWEKPAQFAGIHITPDELHSVFLFKKGNKPVVRELVTTPISAAEATSRPDALKKALRELNKTVRLKATQIYAALSSEQVSFKFMLLPALSEEQLPQAIQQQMKIEKDWDPKKYYIDSSSVGMIGNQTRVFTTYVEREIIEATLLLFAGFGCETFCIEPDITALHRALHFSKMLSGQTLAMVDANEREGRLTIFTDAGAMLSRLIGGKQRAVAEEGGKEEAGGESKSEEEEIIDKGGGGEVFDIDLAIKDMKKTFDYYEYSLVAGTVGQVTLVGNPKITNPLQERVTAELGLPIKPFVLDIELSEKAAEGFDPAAYGVSVGSALGGIE